MPKDISKFPPDIRDWPTCTANVKTCHVDSGGCGYRYQKGDAKWQEGGKCPQCGRHRRCIRDKIKGANVCQVHGVGSPRQGRVGGNPRQTWHDQRRAFMPKEIGRTYERAMADPDLRRFDRNLATQEAMIADSLRRMQTGESREAWSALSDRLPAYFEQLRASVRAYQAALRAFAANGSSPENRKAVEESLSQMTALITGPEPDTLQGIVNRGLYASAARDELRAWEEQQRKTKESDMRQLKDLKAMVAIDQFVRFTEAVAVAVERRVADPALRRAIGFDVQEILSLPGSVTVELPVDD